HTLLSFHSYLLLLFFVRCSGHPPDLHSFPTRRSSDLPASVLRDYTSLTGRTPLPPLWALGYQQSRYSYTPDTRVREIAHEFRARSEEHTSELQSRENLVCRLLLEKKKTNSRHHMLHNS